VLSNTERRKMESTNLGSGIQQRRRRRESEK